MKPEGSTEVADPRAQVQGDSVTDSSPDAIVFERLAPDVQVPTRSTAESAGYDVRAHLTHGPIKVFRGARSEVASEAAVTNGSDVPSITLEPGDRALVPTGFRARLPSQVHLPFPTNRPFQVHR